MAVSGAYNATFNGQPAGDLRLSMTSGGTFTGQILIGGHTYALLGHFLPDGTAEAQVKTDTSHPNLVVDLSFDLAGGTNALTGTIGYTDGSDPVSFAASSTVGQAPTGLAGAWTVVLRSSAEDLPSVTGFATVKVSATGAVLLAGRVSDGLSLQPWSAGGRIGSDAVLHLYSALFPKNRLRFGSVSGDVHFGATASGTVMLHEETVKTTRAAGTTSTVVADDALQLTGSPYVPVKPGAATLTLASDLSSSSVAKAVVLGATGRAVVKNPARDGATLQLLYRTGYFSGTFIPATLGTRVGYAGVIESGSGAATGNYLRLRYVPATGSYAGDFGAVTLKPGQ